MEAMRESWTDGRLDDLNARFDQRFDQVNQRFDQVSQRFDRIEADLRAHRVETKTEFVALRGEMKAGFELVDARFDAMHRLLVQFCGLMLAALVGLVASLIGLVATQL
jgi:chromosome segregation ATPase